MNSKILKILDLYSNLKKKVDDGEEVIIENFKLLHSQVQKVQLEIKSLKQLRSHNAKEAFKTATKVQRRADENK